MPCPMRPSILFARMSGLFQGPVQLSQNTFRFLVGTAALTTIASTYVVINHKNQFEKLKKSENEFRQEYNQYSNKYWNTLSSLENAKDSVRELEKKIQKLELENTQLKITAKVQDQLNKQNPAFVTLTDQADQAGRNAEICNKCGKVHSN